LIVATLVVNTIDRIGTIADLISLLSAAAGGGDVFPNDGQTFLVIDNGDVAGKTVTIAFNTNINVDGQAPSAKTITVAAGKIAIEGPWPSQWYNDVNGNVDLTYSAVTNLKVGVFNLTDS
jgi:hypothetical protein